MLGAAARGRGIRPLSAFGDVEMSDCADGSRLVYSCDRREAEVVVKRFQSGCRNGARREWAGLHLLLEHAPGLAPRPLREDVSSDVAVISMERLVGQPLRGLELSETHLAALAPALNSLMYAPPLTAIADLEVARSRPEHVMPRLHEPIGSCIDLPRPVVQAVRLSQEWATGASLVEGPLDCQTVFGHGDGNLANYLYDGSRVQIVDFEDCGRSDRPCELAEIVEPIAFWHEAGFSPTSLTCLFDLNRAEQGRLLECRRMHASAWLRILISDLLSDRPRNHPETLAKQAGRLLCLLDEG